MRSARQGFTLPVVLVATLILTALLTTVTGLVHLDARLRSYAAHNLQARAAADAVGKILEHAWLEAVSQPNGAEGWVTTLPDAFPWPVQLSTVRTLEGGDLELDYVVQVGRARLSRWLRLNVP